MTQCPTDNSYAVVNGSSFGWLPHQEWGVETQEPVNYGKADANSFNDCYAYARRCLANSDSVSFVSADKCVLFGKNFFSNGALVKPEDGVYLSASNSVYELKKNEEQSSYLNKLFGDLNKPAVSTLAAPATSAPASSAPASPVPLESSPSEVQPAPVA